MPESLSILWLKSGPLFPLNTGGRKRTHAMLREINKAHHVTYLAFTTESSPVSPDEIEADYADEKHWIPLREPRAPSPGFFLSLARNLFFSRLPWALEKWISPSMKKAIEEQCQLADYDLVVCDFLYPAPNAVDVELTPPLLLFQHNMESQIWERMAANKENPISKVYFRSQFQRMYRAERRLSEAFSGIVTVSPEDTEFSRSRYQLTNVLGDVPTGVDTDYFRPSGPPAASKQLGFLGSMDWMPNIEGVTWFVEDIYPDLLSKDPAIELKVIGRNPPPSIEALGQSHPQITITGTVEDVRPHLSECRALVVPLISGGGTRIKILEAISMGIPVISTTVGAEGLSLESEEHLLLADSEDDFAKACHRVLSDDHLAQHLAYHGRAKVLEEHTWSQVTQAFLDHCYKVVRGTASPRHP